MAEASYLSVGLGKALRRQRLPTVSIPRTVPEAHVHVPFRVMGSAIDRAGGGKAGAGSALGGAGDDGVAQLLESVASGAIRQRVQKGAGGLGAPAHFVA